MRLSTARVNLKNAHHALNISLISAYKNPRPDPLQAALEARNFGQVLEQFALLDRAQSYNASILTDIRDYRKDVDASQRVLNRERNARRDTVAELQSLKGQIKSSIAADKRRYNGLRAKVRRLIEERRQAEIAASRRVAEQQRRLQAAAEHPGGRRQRHRRRRRSPSSQRFRRLRRAPVALDGRRVRRQLRARAARHAVRLGRRLARRLRLLRPRLLGLRPGRPRRTAALHRRALELGHAHLLAGRPRAGRPRVLPRPRPRRAVHRRRQLRARAAHRRRREDLEPRQLRRLRRRRARQRLDRRRRARRGCRHRRRRARAGGASRCRSP